MKQLLEAVRKHCLECSPNGTLEECSYAACQFFQFIDTFSKWNTIKGQFGGNRRSKSVKLPGIEKRVHKTLLYKLIRKHCLDCCGESPLEVANCHSRRCGLWPYRLGHAPSDNCTILDRIEKELLADPVESLALDIFKSEDKMEKTDE